MFVLSVKTVSKPYALPGMLCICQRVMCICYDTAAIGNSLYEKNAIFKVQYAN